MKYVIIISIVSVIILLLRLFKKPIRKWMSVLKYKLQIQSLRSAIKEADDDKEETGRKNMVVFNQQGGNFETIQKNLLKRLANKNKNKNNAKMTEGRKKFMQKKKKTYITTDKVKTIEKKSLYVTE